MKLLKLFPLQSKLDAKRSTSACSNSRSSDADADAMRCLRCHVCQFVTELPALGGVRQLPQNFMLVRRIEALRLQAGDDVISRVWCSLCSDDISVGLLH